MIHVNTTKPYTIYFGLQHLHAVCATLPKRRVIISDDTVAAIYGAALSEQLDCPIITMPAGEHAKTRTTKEQLEDQLLQRAFMRDTCIIALGGGVVTDMAGFIAATYCRGVPFIAIPTTLLAMVDASIGGKTGVNTNQGKNLVGAFYQPSAVFIESTMLATLSQEEMNNGIVESIKHALIASPSLYQHLMEHADDIIAHKEPMITEMIRQSCQVKVNIVTRDEFDTSVRATLNCGHTIAHAIEAASDYRIAHGLAVAAGLVMECEYAIEQGMVDPSMAITINQLLHRYAIDVSPIVQRYSRLQLQSYFTRDKKTTAERATFIVPKTIGSTVSVEFALPRLAGVL